MQAARQVRSFYTLKLILAAALASTLILPPKLLVAFIAVAGLPALYLGWLEFRNNGYDRIVLVVAGMFVAGAVFCLMGTFPIQQKSDIQFEFLKFAVYATAFMIGFVALREKESCSAFTIVVYCTAITFFVFAALASGPVFRISQAWMFYSPDQNNTASILIPLLPAVLALRLGSLRAILLVLGFLFCSMIESRVGVLVLCCIIIINIFLDWRYGIPVLLCVVLIWMGLSWSDTTPQDTLIRQIKNLAGMVTDGTFELDRNLPRQDLLQIGTWSDRRRLEILAQALTAARQTFPNLIGMGDAAAVVAINTPPILDGTDFQHAHNFLLQGYLAYGSLATFCLFLAFVTLLVVSVKRKNWVLAGTLVIIGGFGMIEALISDVRVLTVLLLFVGGQFRATVLEDRRA
ncbi:hypothetical protein E2K80_10325 [Rhodophyticola sp. CCM32]|uniref:O-antigen ligase family protein n=1 Tax=Rhodophyticola sp. CCM32 TaxID=2916397 RepID=UPI00107FB0FB|nr:O-antigen ligase family protein [Rhodophyticola sp. CCM32]QBY01074.1 hypothetical protein E2K80_10325 [Rhodophyticola sp. CCM32]